MSSSVTWIPLGHLCSGDQLPGRLDDSDGVVQDLLLQLRYVCFGGCTDGSLGQGGEVRRQESHLKSKTTRAIKGRRRTRAIKGRRRTRAIKGRRRTCNSQ